MAPAHQPVLIVGGGIGGLAFARACQQRELPWALVERTPVPREIGAGLTLWPNALWALRRLGLDGAVLAAGARLERGIVRTHRGGTLFEVDLAALDRELGAPSVALHRAALQGILRTGLPGASLNDGFDVREIAQDVGGVWVRSSDSRVLHGRACVGADGLHSVVRGALHGTEPPRYAGYSCWRTIVDDPQGLLPVGIAEEVWGRGARCGALRIDARSVYAFATLNAPAGQRAEDERELLRQTLDGWKGAAPELLTSSEPRALLRHDIFDRTPRKPWGRGRITLLGDAAHPMTPNLGQGACTAIEDALVLSDALTREPEVARALEAYERSRHERTARLVRKARFLGRVGQEPTRLLGGLRNLLIRLRSRRSMAREMRSYADYRTDARPT